MALPIQIDYIDLLAVLNAITAAEQELAACHRELTRLAEVEFIPVQHQPDPRLVAELTARGQYLSDLMSKAVKA